MSTQLDEKTVRKKKHERLTLFQKLKNVTKIPKPVNVSTKAPLKSEKLL